MAEGCRSLLGAHFHEPAVYVNGKFTPSGAILPSNATRPAWSLTMRDVVIAAGVVVACWAVLLLPHVSRVGLGCVRDLADHWPHVSALLAGFFRDEGGFKSGQMASVLHVARWIRATLCHWPHADGSAAAARDVKPPGPPRSEPADGSRQSLLVRDILRLSFQILRKTRIPAMLWLRLRDRVLHRARPALWAVAAFAVSASSLSPDAPLTVSQDLCHPWVLDLSVRHWPPCMGPDRSGGSDIAG